MADTTSVTSTSFNNTPQAKDDTYSYAEIERIIENGVAILNVMVNDLGGNAKTLFSIDDGDSTKDLLTKDSFTALDNFSRLGAAISITSDGKIAYDVGHANFFRQLSEGEKVVDTFTYAIRLGNGTLSWATVTVNLVGTNDAPTVIDALTAMANEDDSSFTLNLIQGAVDVDHGSMLSVKNVSGLIAGLTLIGTTLTVDPKDAAFQKLAAGVEQKITLSYDIVDEHGATVAQIATITITGANDAPVVTGAVTGQATEDVAAVTLNALANASDVDAGTTLAVVDLPASLPAGVTYDTTAKAFTMNPSNTAYQSLAEGQTMTVTVNYGVSDGKVTTPASVSWTVTGTNDAAVIGAPTVAAVTEDVAVADGKLTATGSISVSDADQNQGSFQTTVTPAQGTLGSLTLAANGSYTYSVANSAAQYLNASNTKVDTFTVTAIDGTTKEVSFTIFGANEKVPDLTLEVTASISGNQLPSGSFAKIVPDSIGGQGAYSYQMTLTEKTYSGTVVSDTSPDLLLSTTGVLTAVNGGNGIEEGRIYEMGITVTQGTATYSESFSLITGTNSNDLVDGIAATGDDVIFALSNNSGIDVIFAGTGNDTVFGQNGMDEIHGGDGKDFLSGGAGNDTFVFDTTLDLSSVDHIADFTNNEDIVLLAHTVFSNLATTSGTLQASEFAAVTDGSGASTTVGSNVHIVYDSKTGNLFYDSDGGSADTGRTLFAVLDNQPISGSTGFDNNDIKIG